MKVIWWVIGGGLVGGALGKNQNILMQAGAGQYLKYFSSMTKCILQSLVILIIRFIGQYEYNEYRY